QERRQAAAVPAQGHEVGMARSGPRAKAAHGTALDLGRPGDAVGRLIALALEEDVGPGDRTAEACVPPSARGSALIFAKEPLIVSGISAAARVFRALDPGCELEALAGESDAANPGEGILRVRGSLRAILTGERTALNLLMRLCGVATITRRYAQALAGTKTRLLDTRKTTPGMRELEKAAVRAGGGFNHRGALFDGILVKDNPAAAAGGIGGRPDALSSSRGPQPDGGGRLMPSPVATAGDSHWTDLHQDAIVLALLLECADDFVAGGVLCDKLDVPRAELLKRIDSLRARGYVIHTRGGLGYRLVEIPDQLGEAQIAPLLASGELGRKIHHFEELESTNDEGHRLAEA